MTTITTKLPIPLIYCAGRFSAPDRAGVEANILRMSLLGLEVAKLGACPWIPHANTALPAFEHVQPYQFWIDATMEQMRRCDAAIFESEWRLSSGARGEHEEAKAIGMPVFYSLKELAAWLEARSWPIPAKAPTNHRDHCGGMRS